MLIFLFIITNLNMWCCESKEDWENAWLKVIDTCIGCGACVAICGDVFELNEEWIAFVKKWFNQSDDSIDDAIWACPVSAIVK